VLLEMAETGLHQLYRVLLSLMPVAGEAVATWSEPPERAVKAEAEMEALCIQTPVLLAQLTLAAVVVEQEAVHPAAPAVQVS
jgi:hypothetical protein